MPIIYRIQSKICLAPLDEALVIHETGLARELGVSRTPIRQALQELALSGFVEVRAGIGTIAPALDPARRERDFIVYSEIAKAAATCSQGQEIPVEPRVNLAGELALVESMVNHDKEAFVQFGLDIANAMGAIVEDPILGHALKCAHWRVLRWRAGDYAANPEAAWLRLQEALSEVVRALRANDAGEVLRAVSGINQRFKTPHQPAGSSDLKRGSAA